jgi:2-keto-4-pentenoate hydratase/2-oxohepta-3-ene-1,7-dioic acid hydratase in catechol pathway
MRDHPRHPVLAVDWRGRKAHEGLTPMGPAIKPARFVADPMDLDLQLTVNGEVRQHANTSELIISIAQQISQISQTAPLLPGDLLMTGTPAGTARGHGKGYLSNGDHLVASVGGVASLANTVWPTASIREPRSYRLETMPADSADPSAEAAVHF